MQIGIDDEVVKIKKELFDVKMEIDLSRGRTDVTSLLNKEKEIQKKLKTYLVEHLNNERNEENDKCKRR